ncbi:FRIGIDA-like protein 3 [Tasmannia lanceolata]|uniref:FRIGIDA-like protein 3 n=1 Tax=Tasmannia lanceolata TaxID=3420 RepID=UPI004062B32B
MADREPAVMGIESTTMMIEQLGKAFSELEAHREASSDNIIQWNEIEEHLRNLESSLKEKFDELAEKEKAFEDKESVLAQREADIAAKEQALLDRLQELKDTAVAAIVEARKNYKAPSPEPTGGAHIESKVSSFSNGEKSIDRPGEHPETMAVEVEPRPELQQLCEQMDAKGLLKFISENRKDLAAIREEIPVALKSATEPARLVLDSLEGFYPPVQTTHQGNKKDQALQGLRRSCVLLMESVAPLLVGPDHTLSSETKQQAKAIADEWKPKLGDEDIDAKNGNSLEAQGFLQLLATFNIASEFDEDELCKLVLAVASRSQKPELYRSLGLTHKMPGVIEALVDIGRHVDAVHLVLGFQLTESFPPVPLLKTYLRDLRRNAQGKGGNSGSADGQDDAIAEELAALKAVIKCIDDYKLEAEYPLDPLQRRLVQLEKVKSDKKRAGDAAKPQFKRVRTNGGFSPRMPVFAAERQPPSHPIFSNRIALRAGSQSYPLTTPITTYDYEAPRQGLYGQQANVQPSYLYPEERVQATVQPSYLYPEERVQATIQPSYLYPEERVQANVQPSHLYAEERVPANSFNASSNYGAYLGSGMQSSYKPYM